jgi:hypothetical protein
MAQIIESIHLHSTTMSMGAQDAKSGGQGQESFNSDSSRASAVPAGLDTPAREPASVPQPLRRNQVKTYKSLCIRRLSNQDAGGEDWAFLSFVSSLLDFGHLLIRT